MALVEGGAPGDISAATSTVPVSSVPLPAPPPPPPPPRNFLHRNKKVTKIFPRASQICSLPFNMEMEPDPSETPNPVPPSSSPPPPAHLSSIMSPPPPDLPPPPDTYPCSSSPPLPPPPPTYLFSELSSEDLPLPPPPQLFLEVSPPPSPLYICDYDPPSPEIKSEYDPPLPLGFSSKFKHFPSQSLPPPLPPPPRPTPPPPPTPPVRQSSRENLVVPPHLSASDSSLCTAEGNLCTESKDSKTSESLSRTDDEFHKNFREDTPDGRPPSSLISSSTLTATFLQTPESGMSPLPPHALRVSPLSTDAITPSSQMTDDFTMTPLSSDLTSTSNFYDTSKDSTIDMDTPEATPQMSETPGTNPCTPSGEAVSPVLSENFIDTAVLPQYRLSPIKPLEMSDTPDSSRSECSLQIDEKDSVSQKTNSTHTERSNLETLVGLNTATSTTTGHAQMSSPLSTEPPSLFSLPTDSDTISADFDSFAADTLSPAAEFDSFVADVDASSIDTHMTGRTVDTHLTTSSSGLSDTAYATAESALDSTTISPAFTESCTITPISHDYRTPLSTNPTTTPIPSPIPTEALGPIPSSPLLYSDAYSTLHMTLPLTCKYSPSPNTQAVNNSAMSLTSTEHCEASNMKRLVRSQTSESSVVASVRHSCQMMSLVPLTSPDTSHHTHSYQSSEYVAKQDYDGTLSNSHAGENMVKNHKIVMNNSEEKVKGHRQEFQENKQNFKHGHEDELPVKQNEIKSVKQSMSNMLRNGDEWCSPDEPELRDTSQEISKENDVFEKTTNKIYKDSQDAKLNQYRCNQVNGVKLNDVQVEENKKSQEDKEKPNETNKSSVKVNQDKGGETHAVTYKDIQQYTNEVEIPQNNFQEVTLDYYEAVEDINGNISYVIDDEQEECPEGNEVEKKPGTHEVMKDDYREEVTKGVVVESKITSKRKEPVEVTGDKEAVKEISECTFDEDEKVKRDEVTCPEEKIPLTSSLPIWMTQEQADFYHPLLTSLAGTSPWSPAPGWKTSSPSSPTQRCISSNQFYTFPYVNSSLSPKSLSVPSSPFPNVTPSKEGNLSSTVTPASPTPAISAGMEVAYPERKLKTSSLSAAPKETMQPLNTVVMNFENMSECLSASQCPKQERSFHLLSSIKPTDGGLDSEAGTEKAYLHQKNKDYVESKARLVSTTKNQMQEIDSSNQEEVLGTRLKSESFKEQYLSKSSVIETEIVKAIDAENVLSDIYNSGSCKICDTEFTKEEDILKNEKCVSANDQHNITQSTLNNSGLSCLTGGVHSLIIPDSPQDYCAFPTGIVQNDCQLSHVFVTSTDLSSNRLSSAYADCDASIALSNACRDTSVSPFPSLQCHNHLVDSTNTDNRGVVLKGKTSPGDETLVKTIQEDTIQITTTSDQKLFTENSTRENSKVLDLGINVTKINSVPQSCVKRDQIEYNHENHLESESVALENNSNIDFTKIIKTSDSPSSLTFSPALGSILEDVAPPSPAPCAKTPPLPPPRSCVSTPRPAVGVPLPPPRQYMLIPINQPQGTVRRLSPPPAPPRTTSARKSSPPSPPPRSGVYTDAAKNEWIDFPPLPPPPTSCINTPSTPPPKLTPVPEESLSPTPLPSAFASPRISQAGSFPIDGTVHSEQGITHPKTLLTSEEYYSASSSMVTYTKQVDESGEIESPSNTQSHTVSSMIEDAFLHLKVFDRNDPPAVPPPPTDFEEEPPPPPTPPVESEDELVPPLPLPPPPDALLSPPTLSPLRVKVLASPLLPKSSSSESKGYPVSSDHDAQSPNTCSIPPLTQPENILTYVSTIPPPPTLSTSKVPAAPPPPVLRSTSLVPLRPTPPLPPKLPASLVPPTSPSSLNPPLSRAPKSEAEVATTSPLITTSPYGKLVIIRSDLPLPSPEEEIRMTFANVKDWGLLDEDVDTLSLYTQLRPVIQQGPQCGLVALSMASQVFPETVDVVDLLQAAKAHGFSCHGEMFNSDAMASLAESINSMEATVRRDVLCNPRTVLEILMQGDLILVPYDAERNFMPGLRGGYKAHWGVICGCLVQCQFLNVHMGGASKPDSRVDCLYHLRPRSRVGVTGSAKSRDGSVTPGTPTAPGSPWMGHRPLKTPDQAVFSPVFDNSKITEMSHKEGSISRCLEMDTWNLSSSRVNTPMLPEFLQDEIKLVALMRQGKSRKLVAASLEKLCESNDQLVAYPPPTTPQEMEYVIGSVQDGLAGQVVVLHKTKPALSDLVGILQEKKSC